MRFKKLLATVGAVALMTGMGLAASQPSNAAEQPADQPYTIVAWTMPSWTGDNQATWPQTLAGHVESATATLDALDSTLKCGAAYQIDIYHSGDAADALIAQGTLTASGEDSSALISGGWGDAYKVMQTVPCPTVATCDAITDGGVSTNLDANGWGFSESRSTGHNDYVDGGLHVWTESNGSTDKAAGYHALSIPLSEVGDPAIALSNASGALPSIQLGIDRDGNGTWDGYIVHEGDIYGAGMWWTNKTGFGVAPGLGYPSLGTLNDYLAANPNAKVTNFGYSLGSGAKGGSVISSITVGCQNYTFNHLLTPITTQPAPPVFTDTCGTDGTTTLPADTKEYSYEKQVVEGVTHVVVKPADGYQFDGKTVTTWDHTFTNVPCPVVVVPPTTAPAVVVIDPAGQVKDLASTGQDIPVLPLALGAFLLIAAGAGALTTRRRRMQH